MFIIDIKNVQINHKINLPELFIEKQKILEKNKNVKKLRFS